MRTALAVDRSERSDSSRTTEAEMVTVETSGDVATIVLDDGVTLDFDVAELRRALAA